MIHDNESVYKRSHEAGVTMSPPSGRWWLGLRFGKLTLPASLSGRPESLSEDFPLVRLSRE